MASNADVMSIASEWKEELKDLLMDDFDASRTGTRPVRGDVCGV